MARPSNSWVWEFFIRQINESSNSGNITVECRFCNKSMKYISRNGPTNLSRHLSRSHQMNELESTYNDKSFSSDFIKGDVDSDTDAHNQLSNMINSIADDNDLAINLSENHESLDMVGFNTEITNSNDALNKYSIDRPSSGHIINKGNKNNYEPVHRNLAYDLQANKKNLKRADMSKESVTNLQYFDSNCQKKVGDFKRDVNLLPLYRLRVPKPKISSNRTVRLPLRSIKSKVADNSVENKLLEKHEMREMTVKATEPSSSDLDKLQALVKSEKWNDLKLNDDQRMLATTLIHGIEQLQTAVSGLIDNRNEQKYYIIQLEEKLALQEKKNNEIQQRLELQEKINDAIQEKILLQEEDNDAIRKKLTFQVNQLAMHEKGDRNLKRKMAENILGDAEMRKIGHHLGQSSL